MAIRSPEEELQLLDRSISDIKLLVDDDYGGFGELRAKAKKGNVASRELLEDYDNLRARRDKVALGIRGFS